MLASMQHRGPDWSDHQVLDPVALGQCMLETTAEDAIDRLPLRSPRREHWIVADARLDNREELLESCAKDEDSGTPTKPADGNLSDAALVLRAYERWGTDCASKLLGDFSFAVWDAEEKRLYCARDQVGIRPLFYRADPTAFRCASEMKALFVETGVTRRPDWLAMALFACGQYTENDQTLYQDVVALPGAHCLVVTDASLQIERYWRPDPWRRWVGASDQEYADRFGEIFAQAVRCRLRSTRPVAVHVSGGMDSSAVAVQVAGEHRSGPVQAQSPLLERLVFPGLACDESPFSQAVADACDLPLATFNALDDFEALRPHVDPAHPELYFAPTVLFLIPPLRLALERGIRTTLSGLGADQLFLPTGLETLADVRAGRLGRVLAATNLDERPLALGSWRALARALRPAIGLAAPRLSSTVGRWLGSYPPRAPWLTPRAKRAVIEHELAETRRHAAERYPDAATRAKHEYFDGFQVKYCASVGDRVAGSVGAEFRHPFFDVRLLELVLTMPWEQGAPLQGNEPKPVLRRAMQGRLPDLVRDRERTANLSCYVELALTRHQGLVRRLFEQSLLAETGILDSRQLLRILDRPGRDAPLRVHLAEVVALELWLRHMTS